MAVWKIEAKHLSHTRLMPFLWEVLLWIPSVIGSEFTIRRRLNATEELVINFVGFLRLQHVFFNMSNSKIGRNDFNISSGYCKSYQGNIEQRWKIQLMYDSILYLTNVPRNFDDSKRSVWNYCRKQGNYCCMSISTSYNR